MAATHTLTGSFTDLLGDTFDTTRIRGYVKATQPVIVDTDPGGGTRFGRKALTINTDGTWSVAGLPDTSDLAWKPAGFGLILVVEYRDDAQGTATRSQPFESNAFELTADTDFKDVVDIELVAVDTALRDTIHQWALDAQAAAEAAEAVGASTDAQMAGRIQDPESETSAALSASTGDIVDTLAAPRAGLSAKDQEFGATGLGVVNDGVAIQALIDTARDSVRAGFALGAGMAFIPGGRYRTTQRIVQPPYVKVVTLGPVVILSEVPGDSTWHLTPLADDPANLYPGVLDKQQWTRGDVIDASHGGITFVNQDPGGAGATIGLELGPRTDIGSDRPMARYSLSDGIAAEKYAEGVRWNSYNHYIAHYKSLHLEKNVTDLHVVGPGSNSGENITFERCIFASTVGTGPSIKVDAPNIDLTCVDCSGDFVGTLVEINRGYGTFRWTGNHVEGINENARFSETGGLVVSNVATSAPTDAPPVVEFGPLIPLVASARGVRFRGSMYLSLSLQYRVQSSDYSTNQSPAKAVLCDDLVRVVSHELVLTRGGPLVQRGLNEVRDATLTADAAGTLGSALTHWARTNGGAAVTSVVSTDAPLAGYQSLEITMGAASFIRWMPKAYTLCRPGDVIYGTFAAKAAPAAPEMTSTIAVAWYDSEKVQIGSTEQINLTKTVTTTGDWRVPDGPVRLTPPPGAVFYKGGIQVSTPTGDGSTYWVGYPQFERRSA